MKYILLWAIKSYWFLIAAPKRNHCIFKKSCSQHVYSITNKEGLIKGIQALKFRYTHCRPGYSIMVLETQTLLVSKHYAVFQEKDIAPRILHPFEPSNHESL